MFTQAFNNIIDSVSDAKKTFVDSYFVESFKEPMLAYVEAQRTIAKEVTSSVDTFVADTTSTAKKAFKL